jgi:hypothetical protein
VAPNLMAVATVDGEQTSNTSVMEQTLRPRWSESFFLFVELVLPYHSASANRTADGSLEKVTSQSKCSRSRMKDMLFPWASSIYP